MTRMGRSVLPVSEQILFALNWLWRHCVNRAVKPYVPDFRQAFDHFCLHAGAPPTRKLAPLVSEASGSSLAVSQPWFRKGTD